MFTEYFLVAFFSELLIFLVFFTGLSMKDEEPYTFEVGLASSTVFRLTLVVAVIAELLHGNGKTFLNFFLGEIVLDVVVLLLHVGVTGEKH